MVESDDHVLLHWDNEMQEAVSEMMGKAIKYFIEPDQGLGWSFTHVTDPFLAPHYALVVLNYLRVNRERSDQNDSTDSVEDNVWSISSKNHVYPQQIYEQYREKIMATFLDNDEVTTAVFNAYGLRHITVIKGL